MNLCNYTRATGECPYCRESLRFDEEAGEYIPHRCAYDDSDSDFEEADDGRNG